MPARDFDLFVIGGGSAGVRLARISAGYGARVAVAEERFWGGTCKPCGFPSRASRSKGCR